MHQTIIELWRGNIAPYEHCGSRDEEATQLLELMEKWEQLAEEAGE